MKEQYKQQAVYDRGGRLIEIGNQVRIFDTGPNHRDEVLGLGHVEHFTHSKIGGEKRWTGVHVREIGTTKVWNWTGENVEVVPLERDPEVDPHGGPHEGCADAMAEYRELQKRSIANSRSGATYE